MRIFVPLLIGGFHNPSRSCVKLHLTSVAIIQNNPKILRIINCLDYFVLESDVSFMSMNNKKLCCIDFNRIIFVLYTVHPITIAWAIYILAWFLPSASKTTCRVKLLLYYYIYKRYYCIPIRLQVSCITSLGLRCHGYTGVRCSLHPVHWIWGRQGDVLIATLFIITLDPLIKANNVKELIINKCVFKSWLMQMTSLL